MPHRVVRILLVDDDEEDAFITEELLGDAPGRFDLTWISSYESALRTAAERDFDVCLVDYRIGGETGIEFLEKATAQGVACPMIMLTGVGQHEIDVAASEVGAADFLDKGSLTPILLERAIRYAIANASALRELAEQQEVLATTMESLQGGIVAFDACGQVLASNQRFETLMEQIGSHNGPGRRLSPVDMARQLLETIDDRQRDNVVEMESSDGRAFEIRISPVPGRGNVFLIVDSTEQKTLQRRILEAKIAAEKSNTAKSAFLAKVSHELRTPLNGVFGMAQLLKMTTLDQKQEVHVNRLIESAMGLMALIEDLLDISLVEQGHFKLRNDEINIEEIVTDACTVA
ncbi:MAG: histidine kinase dimerization/phospho-acceptor domain-containing protein, partial [Pseudomonadota bacterium]